MINNNKFNALCDYALYFAKEMNIDTDINEIRSIFKNCWVDVKNYLDAQDVIYKYFEDILNNLEEDEVKIYEEELEEYEIEDNEIEESEIEECEFEEFEVEEEDEIECEFSMPNKKYNFVEEVELEY